MLCDSRELAGLPRRTSGFDFLIGTWKVANRRLRSPLTGSDNWYETDATAISGTLHNGAISIDEMWYPDLGFAGSPIRVHTPHDDTWTIYWVNSDTGHLQPPVKGRWSADGETFVGTGPDEFGGSPILARFLWHSIAPDSAVWEQAFSTDEGATWETNWVMTWIRTGASGLVRDPGDCVSSVRDNREATSAVVEG